MNLFRCQIPILRALNSTISETSEPLESWFCPFGSPALWYRWLHFLAGSRCCPLTFLCCFVHCDGVHFRQQSCRISCTRRTTPFDSARFSICPAIRSTRQPARSSYRRCWCFLCTLKSIKPSLNIEHDRFIVRKWVISHFLYDSSVLNWKKQVQRMQLLAFVFFLLEEMQSGDFWIFSIDSFFFLFRGSFPSK